MFFNELYELVDVLHDFCSVELDSLLSKQDSTDSSFKITSSDVQPLIDQCTIVKARAIELIAGNSCEVADNGVGGGEGSVLGDQ